MVISVLERRGEIGLRRALGARVRHIAIQFILESIALAVLGGLAGVGLGCLATLVAAHLGGNTVAIPLDAPLAGFAAALIVGVLAGVYPQPAPSDSHQPTPSAPPNGTTEHG